MSWRDRASEQAQADLDGLLEPALESAQHQLDLHGEFYPFAVVIDDVGQRFVAVEPESDHPDSADVITQLIAVLSGQRDQLRATAVVADVRLLESGGDAVEVRMEHVEGAALTVVLPYGRRRLRRGITYGVLQGVGRHPHDLATQQLPRGTQRTR